MTVDEQLFGRTKGFLDLEEGRRLYRVARAAARLGPCLEIGSYCGKATLFLGQASKENDAILFSIDHHQGSEEQQPGEQYFDSALFNPKTFSIDTLSHFRQTLKTADLEEWVVPLVCASSVAARAWSIPLGMVFIDGGHAYDTVFEDYNCWVRHILPGGYLVMHDIYKDPAEGGQAPNEVYRTALKSGLFIQHPMTMSLGVLERKSENGHHLHHI